MADDTGVIDAAKGLLSKDEEALLLEIGLREEAIQRNEALKTNPNLQVEYDSTHMGLIDNIKSLGLRIMTRWNKELYGIVCPAGKKETAEDKKIRENLFEALKMGDAAVIAAVVTGLMFLGTPAAIAAPLAPFLVKKFIMPAKDELCIGWGEAING